MKSRNNISPRADRIRNLKAQLQNMLQFFNSFRDISDSYIIEFFTEQHWLKLPVKWREVLEDLSPPHIVQLLLQREQPANGYPTVWPLSLLAFKKTAEVFAKPRNQNTKTKHKGLILQDKNLNSVFRRHVNPKKQHEMAAIAEVIKESFTKGKCTHVIDIGSGQGHLSRLLALHHQLPVTAVDCVESHLKAAIKYDKEAICQLSKHKDEEYVSAIQAPQHCMHNITSIGRSCSIMQCLKSAIFKENPVENARFLLTGLHACGDLSATMVKLFAECHEVTAVVSVACCYMKITTDLDQPQMGRMNNQEDSYRYPLSKFVQKLPDHCLPYKSREASCHALEDYKLRLEENTNHLKMHCYRAVLESMIRESYPEIIRPPVQTVKKAYDLPFLEYVKLAFAKLNLKLPNEISDLSRFESMLSRWQQVVTYYTISVMVASVVEMIILLDRMLFLEENNFECELSATFEPTLSPRCFSITAHK